jgi:hypothetical protein
MDRERPKVDTRQQETAEQGRRKAALEVLLEARERLIGQMTEDILSHQELLVEGPGQDGLFGFEFQEIEDRYSARLNALNSLLENLEYRRAKIKYRVETLSTTLGSLKKDLTHLLSKEEWDLVNVDVTRLDGDRMLVVAAFTMDEYDE